MNRGVEDGPGTHRIILLLCLFLAFPPAMGQSIGVPREATPDRGILSIPRPGEERLPPPEYKTPEKLPKMEAEPAPPQPSKERRLLDQPTVTLKAIRVEDSKVLSPKEIDAITSKYINKPITTLDLQRLRYELTVLYVDKGYTTSGVIIPDQNIEDDSIYLQAIEGRLSKINVSKNHWLQKQYLEDRIRLAAEPALDENALKDRLQILNQGPLLKQVNAKLSPDTELGKAILDVEVQEATPYRLDFTVDNHGPPSVGALEGTIHAAHLSLTKRGDAADLFYSRSEGLDEFTARYALPVTARDTTLLFSYRNSESRVIEEPFDELDIESDYEDFGLGVQHPFQWTPTRSVVGTVRLERRRSKTFLLGEPFSFSRGAQDGESVVSVVRISGDWIQRTVREVFAVRSLVSIGIDAFDATINDDAPDSRFFSWIGQLQWARRLGRAGFESIFRLDTQLTPDTLLPMEQFPIGGPYSVRGYRTDELVRDNGVVASLEFRAPLLHNFAAIGTLELAAFADYGRSWNAKGKTPDPKDLSSVGLAIHWNPLPRLNAQLSWAYAFRDIDQADHDLQDAGINFMVSYNVFSK